MAKFIVAFLVWLFATGKAKDWGNLVFKTPVYESHSDDKKDATKPEGSW